MINKINEVKTLLNSEILPILIIFFYFYIYINIYKYEKI